MEAPTLTKVDVYFVAQSHSSRSYWSALMKAKSREKALARISKSSPEGMVAEGIREVLGLLKTPCLVGLYANVVIPADSAFEPHQVEWHGERSDHQKAHFDRVGILAQLLFTLTDLLPEIVYLIPVAVRNCWTVFVITESDHVEVISDIDTSTDRERRLHLLAVTNGLSVAPSPPQLPICICTDSEYILTGQYGLPGWSRTWHTKHGEPLQNADLWQIVWEHYQRRKILWQELPREQADLCKAYAKLTFEQHQSKKQDL